MFFTVNTQTRLSPAQQTQHTKIAKKKRRKEEIHYQREERYKQKSVVNPINHQKCNNFPRLAFFSLSLYLSLSLTQSFTTLKHSCRPRPRPLLVLSCPDY